MNTLEDIDLDLITTDHHDQMCDRRNGGPCSREAIVVSVIKNPPCSCRDWHRWLLCTPCHEGLILHTKKTGLIEITCTTCGNTCTTSYEIKPRSA